MDQGFRETGSAYALPTPHFDADLALVGRGTKMGEMLRRYWHPVFLSSKLRDLPVQVRALGEDIVLFRKPGGEIGALYPRCVHRGASLLYGRPTEQGLRCPYHAWTFEPDGRCTDQPCEPERGRGRGALRQPWYPARERYGLIFVYQGPLEKMPALPRWDVLEAIPEGWQLYADDTTIPSGGAGHMPCNWLQHHENGMDPYHVAVVHEHQFPPIMAQAESVYSFEADEDRVRGRGISRIGPTILDFKAELIIPNIRVIPNPQLPQARPDGKSDSIAWTVPKDDTDTIVFTVMVVPAGTVPDVEAELYNGKSWKDLTFEEHQRFPGDFETQVGQGPITFHSEEHLTPGDKGIVLLRRLLARAAQDVAAGGDPSLAFGPAEIFVTTTSCVVMSVNPDHVPGPAEPAAPVPVAKAGLPAGVEQWALTMQSPMGDQSAVLVVSRQGSALTGTMTGADGIRDIHDGRVAGAELTWKASITKPIPLTLSFKVTQEGATLRGTFKPGMFPQSVVTGVRI